MSERGDGLRGSPFRVSAASADYVPEMWSRQAVLVIGRHLFDLDRRLEGEAAGERAGR